MSKHLMIKTFSTVSSSDAQFKLGHKPKIIFIWNSFYLTMVLSNHKGVATKTHLEKKTYIRWSMLDNAVLYNESNVSSLVPVGSIHGTWLFITHTLSVTAPILNTSGEQSDARAKRSEH